MSVFKIGYKKTAFGTLDIEANTLEQAHEMASQQIRAKEGEVYDTFVDTLTEDEMKRSHHWHETHPVEVSQLSPEGQVAD